MKKQLLLMVALAIGTNASANDASEQPKKTSEDPPAATRSAWTWGYFFAAADKNAVRNFAGDRKQLLTVYRVDRIESVRGKPGVSISPGSTLVRVETAARLPATEGTKLATLLFQGVPQHLEYTSRSQRDDLNKRSRTELPPSKDTVAVVIPIRKSAAWWALPQDERLAFFHKKYDKIGHTAIGAKFVERIYRKLYHTRYAVETTDHDFITYFEFDRAHTDDFKSLLSQLRDTEKNPEWKFVDREYEIWLTKFE